MGPMHDPLVDITKFRDFFPSYHRTKPIVTIKEPINLEYMSATLRVFCYAPSPKRNEDYIFW